MNMRPGMRDFISPNAIVSEARMMRTKNKEQTYLLVEGESDIAFFKMIVDKSCCKVKFCNGKANVIKAIRNVNCAKVKGVVGIVDRDFDEILGKCPDDDNMFLTDTHDFETLSLRDNTFERLNYEYGDDYKLEQFEEKNKSSAFEKMIEIGVKLGKARLCDKKHNLEIGFNDQKLYNYFDDNLNFHFKKFVENAISGSRQKDNLASAENMILNEMKNEYDRWQICRGHDMTEIISIFYSRTKKSSLGNEKASNITSSVVERELRMSYSLDAFYRTDLFMSLLEWQRKNSTIKVINMDKYDNVSQPYAMI